MKKSILSFLLSAAAVCQMLTPVAIAEDNYYSMIWGSDIHSGYMSFNGDYGFGYIADIAANDGDKFKGVIINGDLANTGKVYEYAFLEDAIDEYLADIPVFYSTGNHDVANYDNANCYDAMKVRFEKLKADGYTIEREDKWSYDTYINGHHYIFLSTPYNDKNGYGLLDSQAAWLENKICESEMSGVPTFVFSHLPVSETTTGSFKSGGAISEVKEILQRHPSVIVGTGHVHLDLEQNPNTAVTDEYNTYIDLSSMSNTYAYTNPSTADETAGDPNYSNKYSRYVKIYDDRMVVQSLNMSTGEIIAESDFTVTFDTGKFDGTPSITSDGTTFTAKLNGEDVDTEAYSVEWYSNGEATDVTTAVYTADADDNVCVKISDSDGAYACASTDMPAYTEEIETPSTPDTEEEEIPEITINGSADAKHYNNIVNVSGNVGADNAGKTVTVILISENTYYDLSTAKYINNCVVGTDGSYSFKFKADIASDDVVAVKLDDADVTYSVTSAKSSTEQFVTYDLTLNSENEVVMDIKNVWLDSTTAKIIIAVYDADGNITGSSFADCALDFEKGSYVSDALAAGSTAKAFVWDSVSTMLPLADEADISVPDTVSE